MDTIVLDNGREYAIVKDLKIDGITYTLFSDLNDPKRICFRKTVNKKGEDYYVGLDDIDEFNKVTMKFAEEMNDQTSWC